MRHERNRFEDALGASIAAVTRASARFPKTVIALYLVVTVVMAGGLGHIYVRSADYDLLPNGHASTLANERTLPEVPGYRSIETLYLEVMDPRQNITGVTEIRAQEDVAQYIQARVPGIRYTYDLPYLVKFINYTASGIPSPATEVGSVVGNGSAPPLPALPGPFPPLPPVPWPNGTLPPPPPGPLQQAYGQPIREPDLAAFALPPDDLTFQRDWEVVYDAARPTVEGVVTENYTGAIVVFMYDVDLTRQGPPAVLPQSERFIEAVLQWRDEACPQLTFPGGGPIFNCRHTFILGEAINAHLTALAEEDFQTFAPIVFLATLVVLFFAFDRDVVSTLIALVAFTMGLVWTYGTMGYAGIPLTFFGLLIVPITLGVGKEYAIYVTNQLLEYGARGLPRSEVMDLTGRRAGGALLVSTITSVAGLATMYLAEFKVMQDLALLSILAFLSLFLLSVTLIPAGHALRRRQRAVHFRPSGPMRRLGAGVTRHKRAVAAVLLAGTVLLAAEGTQIEEYFGISGGFQEGDYLEQSYKYYNAAFGGAGTELVVVEGDVADPSFIQYLRDLDAAFKADTAVIPQASNVNSLIIALETYYSLKDGLFNPAALNGDLGRTSIPEDRAVVAADMRAMFAHPVFQHVIALFTGPNQSIAVTHVFYHIRSETFQGLEEDWAALNADVAKVPRPASVREVNLVGTQDTFYLYVKYGQPWLGRVTLYATIITFAIAALVLRRPRDIAAVMGPMLMAGVWWAGLLPLFDIKASLTLMLPTVFLISVGSDYAIQYVWNYRQTGDMAEVYASTGKANFYVVVSTVLAFLLFVPMKLVLSSQGALAAALAILTIFGVTTLAVPLFYRRLVMAPAPPPPAPPGAAASSVVRTRPRG